MSEALPAGIFALVMALRTGIVLLFLFFALCMLGRRELGEMNVFDLTTIMLCANAVQNAMTEGSGNLSVAAASCAALVVTGSVLERVFAGFPGLVEGLMGKPSVLVSSGRVIQKSMKREDVTMDELQMVMREHGITKVKDVQLAVLELDGSISVVPRKD